MYSKPFSSTLKIIFTFLVVGLAMPSLSWAEKKDTPNQIEGSIKVSAEDLLDEVEEHPDLVIIDARIHGDRLQGYIEGSLSLPDIETNCDSLSKLIPSFDNPALFYCNGVKCGRSANSVKVALRCGYNKIYWFRGGFGEWKSKGYPYLSE